MSRKRKRGVKVVECKLARYGAWGFYYFGLNTIEIDPRQPPRQYLNTLIHEVLHHVCQTTKSEAWVRRAAGTISRVVWEQGFRKISE